MSQKFLKVVTLENAMKTLQRWWKPKQVTELVDVAKAQGRVLAEDLFAPLDIPPFDRAAYDGYAVCSIDTFGATETAPKVLKVVGRVAAGSPPKKKVQRGECLEIATGAQLPHGADAVVLVENTFPHDSGVKILRPVSPGENIARKGSDLKKGELLVPQGRVLTAREIGAISAAGVKSVKVFSGPKVAIISTGSELLEAGKRLEPAKIYDANGPLLLSAVKSCGGLPVCLGIARDNPRDILSKLRRALKSADVVIISGGTSAGKGDLVPAIVQKLGNSRLLVHGLALKPGKPTFLAVADGKPIFGLPGYPVSALMIFDLLVAPYIRKMSAMEKEKRQTVRARLAAKLISARGRRSLIPVKVRMEKGQLLAEPLWKDSGAIASLSAADGYIDVPLGREMLEEEDEVEVHIFGS
ncbi:MAG: gephyrin-like molybdotransferase Glp [Candidatus Hadarchaeales archaeon]